MKLAILVNCIDVSPHRSPLDYGHREQKQRLLVIERNISDSNRAYTEHVLNDMCREALEAGGNWAVQNFGKNPEDWTVTIQSIVKLD